MIDKIVKTLEKASSAYYAGNPIMTDAEWDSLRDKLEKLDPDHEFLKTVGSAVSDGVWPKYKHPIIVGSLNKFKHDEKEEFLGWASSIEDAESNFAIQFKMDGSTILLYYEDGKLIRAVTRGSGEEGEVISENVLKMQNVKEELPTQFTGSLRGEIILPISEFNAHFRCLGYKNPRNTANGIARDKRGNDLIKHLKVLYFDVKGKQFETEQEQCDFIKSLGLDFVEHQIVADGESAWKVFESIDRSSLNYEIDGLVVKCNDCDISDSLGEVDNRPKGQMAIKFPPLLAETRINNITWQFGITGRIAPVAEIEPVDVGGITIKRASLNNIEWIQQLDVAIGDKVEVCRSNDVIPIIVKAVDTSNREMVNGNPNINFPSNCPKCKGELVRDGAYIICTNIECNGRTFGNIARWFSANDMIGFGPNTIREIISLGFDTPAKLYSMTQDDLSVACNSEKNGKKLYSRLQDTRDVDLGTFLRGLNIDTLGSTNSKRLERKFEELDAVLSASVDDIASIDGIGKPTAKKIVEGLKIKKNVISDLRQVIKIKNLSEVGPLAGLSGCITGQLWEPRPKIQQKMREFGCEIKTGVSKGLSFLAADDPDSGTSKNKKAKKLGIPVISGEQLKSILDGDVTWSDIKSSLEV